MNPEFEKINSQEALQFVVIVMIISGLPRWPLLMNKLCYTILHDARTLQS